MRPSVDKDIIETYGKLVEDSQTCLVCGRKLRRNNFLQVRKYCSKKCKKQRYIKLKENTTNE